MQINGYESLMISYHLCVRLIYKYPENAFSLHTTICNRSVRFILLIMLSLIWMYSACLFDCFAHLMRRKKGKGMDLFDIHTYMQTIYDV